MLDVLFIYRRWGPPKKVHPFLSIFLGPILWSQWCGNHLLLLNHGSVRLFNIRGKGSAKIWNITNITTISPLALMVD
jgi:hypothetical protein